MKRQLAATRNASRADALPLPLVQRVPTQRVPLAHGARRLKGVRGGEYPRWRWTGGYHSFSGGGRSSRCFTARCAKPRVAPGAGGGRREGRLPETGACRGAALPRLRRPPPRLYFGEVRALQRIDADCVFLQKSRLVPLMRSATGPRDGGSPDGGAAENCVQAMDVVAALHAALAGGEGAEAAARAGAVPHPRHLPRSASPGEEVGSPRQTAVRGGQFRPALLEFFGPCASPAPPLARGRLERRDVP